MSERASSPLRSGGWPSASMYACVRMRDINSPHSVGPIHSVCGLWPGVIRQVSGFTPLGNRSESPRHII